MTGSIVLEYKLHVQISTFGALWAKLPYLFPRNTLAGGFFQKWKSLYYGGILGLPEIAAIVVIIAVIIVSMIVVIVVVVNVLVGCLGVVIFMLPWRDALSSK